METFSNIRFSVKHKKNVLIVVKNVKDIKKFLKFKGKPYLYLPVKKKISFSIRKKFNLIHEKYDLHKMSFLDTVIMINIHANRIYSLINTFVKNPKIIRVIIIENKKNFENKNFFDTDNIFDQFETRIISKKKYKKQDRRDLTLITRRKRLPFIVKSNFKKFFKFFSLRLNSRFGSLIKKKQFIILTSFFNRCKISICLESNCPRDQHYKKFNRFSEELGISTTRIKYYGIKDFLYTISHFFLL